MSSVPWLRAYVGAEVRENVYQKSGNNLWVKQPSYSCYSINTCDIKRSNTLNSAVKWYHDWNFEQNDKGAFTVTVQGTRAAKNGLVIALGSDMGDAFGLYVVLGVNGARVFRRVIGEYSPIEPSSYWRETLADAQGSVRSVPQPLQKSGTVTFTVVYEYGTLRIYEGESPYVGNLVVEYVNNEPGMGNHRWGIGLYGERANNDRLDISNITKWVIAQK